MKELGVIHGRFHVLHNDHLKYIMAGKARCRHMVVGITNPDPTLTKDDSTDKNRSSSIANPLTYFERYTIVRAALEEAGENQKDFSVVPFPVNFPKLYSHYVPLQATFYLTIYDDWGWRKLEHFQLLGLKTEVLWERPLAQKGLNSTDIRHYMARNKPWEHLVPASTQHLLKLWDIPTRLRKLHSNESP